MRTVHLNNQGLQPPEPLIRTLSACERLGPRERLEAIMDRRPMFLFPELDERGFKYSCAERDDGSYLVIVERSS